MAQDTSAPHAGDQPGRDYWVLAGITVTAVAAAASSFTGLRGLAALAGWPPALAVLLPLTIDAYAATATRVWLAPTTPSARACRFARANALGAITASITGNATYHALAAGVIQMAWPIVVLVGSAPAAALGLLAHLAVLRTQPESPAQDDNGTDDQHARTSVPLALDSQDEPGPAPPAGTGADTGTELLARARVADRENRDRIGHPITRDALRRELGIGTGKASTLLRQLRSWP